MSARSGFSPTASALLPPLLDRHPQPLEVTLVVIDLRCQTNPDLAFERVNLRLDLFVVEQRGVERFGRGRRRAEWRGVRRAAPPPPRPPGAGGAGTATIPPPTLAGAGTEPPQRRASARALP